MPIFLLDRLLRKLVRHGRLTVIDAVGATNSYGVDDGGPEVVVRVNNTAFQWKVAFNPSLAVGEGYANGDLTIESGSLRDLLEIGLVSQERASYRPAQRVLRQFQKAYRLKDMIGFVGRSRRNIEHHYDLDHDLYALFLDRDMQYSCAYWRDQEDDLDAAQLNKERLIASKLLLEPGMSVLDIGSGWGGLALHLAREHGVRVTGLTLSQDQLKTSLARAREEGLADLVAFKLLDYRLERDRFDRIVSVGMFEHVGRPYFATFFRQLSRLLEEDGVALIHTIAKMRNSGPISPWIQRYIFPGAYLPTLSELAPVIEKQDLLLMDLEILWLHYAKTLRAWDERFQSRRSEVAARFGERFCRMWEFYLQGCEMTFRFQELCVFQLQLAKKVGAVPITRDYLSDSSSQKTKTM